MAASADMSSSPPGNTVDYLCNAFTPDRRAVWERAISTAGVPVKIVREAKDDFAEPLDMVRRMDQLGIRTLLLPTCDVHDSAHKDPTDFDHVAARWDEVARLTQQFAGRFAALAVVDPSHGLSGVDETRSRLSSKWVAGMYLHTHSWDRRFDHADLYPYYALCSELDIPFVMQAGTSGGLMPSECGAPMGIDRPALYFPGTRFVLSHTGWPWVEDAVAMALKHPNVFLGTAAYPPRHWHGELQRFLQGPGEKKVIFGSNFPTVGHHRAIDQLMTLELTEPVLDNLLSGAANRVFSRLADL